MGRLKKIIDPIQSSKLALFYQQLVNHGKPKMAALVAVMRKILVIMRAVIISRNPYDDALQPDKDQIKPVEKLSETSKNLRFVPI